MDSSLPPLPPGATLDQSGAPPLPPGATLDSPAATTPAIPKTLDTAPIQAQATANIAAAPVPPQTPEERLDVGAGFPASQLLKGGNDGKPLPAPFRAGLVQAQADGTATNAVDYAQQHFPAAAAGASAVPPPNSYMGVVQQAVEYGLAKFGENVIQTGQAVMGRTPEQGLDIPKNLTANYDFSLPDGDTIKKALGKTIYSAISSSPEIVGGLLGSVVGSAKGKVGAIAGGFVGGALSHAIVNMAPIYAEELKANGNDPTKAWDETYKRTAIESGGTGLSYALLGLKPFSGVAQSILFQAFAAQPIAGAATQIASNISTGAPALQGAGQAALEAGIGTAIPAGIHALLTIPSVHENVTPGAAQAESPTAADPEQPIKQITGPAAESPPHPVTSDILLKAAAGEVPGHEDMKPIVGKIMGKPASEVTPQDINQATEAGLKGQGPEAHDYQAVANVMDHENGSIAARQGSNDVLHDENTGLPLNDDGTVTLYHHTSTEKAQQIVQSGKLKADAEPSVYLTTHAQTDTGYGDTAVPINVDPSKLQLDDEFQNGRKDFSIDVGKPGGSIPIKISEPALPDKSTADTLRTIYAETGVRPEQVHADAKNSPFVRADLAAGKVPAAYDHLREPAPAAAQEVPVKASAQLGRRSAYVSIPKKPEGLADWVRRQGGMGGDRGDIMKALGDKAGSKAINRKLLTDDGHDVVTLAKRAWEDGYFPEHGSSREGTEGPSPNNFIDKLREDLGDRTPQYSDVDADVVRDYREALAHNLEQDKMASALGVDAHGMTRAELYDAFAEHMSREEQAHEIQSLTDAAIDESHDVVVAYGKLEPGSSGENATPRTLEELENEHQQAQIASDQFSNEIGNRESGSISANEGAGQGRIGQGGSGAELAGRGGETTDGTEPATATGGSGNGEPPTSGTAVGGGSGEGGGNGSGAAGRGIELSTEGVSTSKNALKKLFNSADISPSSRLMATSIRQGAGPAERFTAAIQAELTNYIKTFNKMSDDENRQFISYIQNRSNGAVLFDPKLQEVADKIADIYERYEAVISEAFPDFHARRDYFTQMWEDSTAASKFYGDWSSQQGSERNLEQRAFPTLEDGIRAGLVPKTLNPIETVMTYAENMGKLIAAHQTVQIAIQHGIADYFKPGQEPLGWHPLNGNLSEQQGKQLYAPEDAARVYNNDISEGITGPGGEIFNAIQRVVNFGDKLFLGLSAYHGVVVTLHSMISDLSRFDFKSMATPYSNTALGRDLIQQYLGQKEISPELREALDLLVRNNAIAIKQQNYYKASGAKDWVDILQHGSFSSEAKKVKNSIKESPITGTIGAIGGELGRVLDTIGKPLFDGLIPRLKIANAFKEMHDWLGKNPNATQEEKDTRAQQIGNSIDNRFGEMMRKNLFMHNILRQALQLVLLSYTWVYGGARALGETATNLKDVIMTGNKTKLSPNARFLFAAAIGYAVVGGLRTFAGTGQAPQSLKDLYYPRTGGTNPDGTPEREIIPGHISQYVGYLTDPAGELQNEGDAVLKIAKHLMTNRDWRELPITNDNNPWFSEQRWGDYLKDLISPKQGELTPLGIRQMEQGEKKGSHITGIEQFLGIRAAGKKITNPEANEAAEKKRNDRLWKQKLHADKHAAQQYDDAGDNP